MKPETAIKNAEKWHKKHHSKNQINFVKDSLKQEIEIDRQIRFIPISHNKDKIYLQFCGWSINLLEDGTWHWEDTTGG